MGNELTPLIDEIDDLDAVGGIDIEDTEDDNEEDDSTSEDTEDDGEEEEESDEEESEEDEESEEVEEESDEEEDSADEDEEEVEGDGEDVEKSAEEIIADLRSKLADQASTPQAPVTSSSEDEDVEEVEIGDPYAEVEIATADNFEDLIDDPAKFNAAINEAMNAKLRIMATLVQQSTVEQVNTTIPNVVYSQVQQVTALQTAVDGFYATHEDLVNFKSLVGQNVASLELANPDWTLEQILPEAAKLTYKQLHIKQQVGDKPKEGKKKAASTGLRKKGKGGTRKKKSVKKVSDLQAEIDDL